MTKARARERAKANALKKAKKRAANTDQPDQPAQTGHFNPGTHSVKGPGGKSSGATFGPAKRGSARSS